MKCLDCPKRGMSFITDSYDDPDIAAPKREKCCIDVYAEERTKTIERNLAARAKPGPKMNRKLRRRAQALARQFGVNQVEEPVGGSELLTGDGQGT